MFSNRGAIIGLLLLLLAGPAVGQLPMTHGGTATPASYTGPGDVVSGAQFFGGLRAYTKAIAQTGTQKLVNLSRASDSHTCDILVAGSGGLGNTANCSTGGDNGQSASSFCNATTCVVVTLYDQTGNSHDPTQATNANRPTLTFNCIGTLPCMSFGSAQTLLGTLLNINLPNTLSVVAERTAGFTSQQSMFGGNGTDPIIGFNSAANQWFQYAGTLVGVTGANDSVWHAANGLFNSASSIINIDGSETSTNPGLNQMHDAIFIGSSITGAKFVEGGIWNVGFSGTQRTNMCKNQQAYYGAGNFGATC